VRVDSPKRHHVVKRRSYLGLKLLHRILDQIGIETIVARFDRSVRCKNALPARSFEGLVKRAAFRDFLAVIEDGDAVGDVHDHAHVVLNQEDGDSLAMDLADESLSQIIDPFHGKQDLKNKLMKILNYQDAQLNRIDLSSADFTVEEAALSYGNGIFWYPSHDFNVVIPELSVKTPQATRNFTMTKQFLLTQH
jgi:hypothetical protein